MKKSSTQSETKEEAKIPNPTTPRWVKVFAIIALALLLLLIILHLTGNSFGGHGLHSSLSNVNEQEFKQLGVKQQWL